MARGIGALNVSVNADTGKATKNIGDFRTEVGRLPGVAGAASGGMGLMSAGLGALAAAGAAAAGVWSLVSPSMDEIDGLAKASDKIGIATEQLAGLRLAAEESGVSVGAFDKGLVKMLRGVAEASGGMGEAKEAFAALGLSAQAMISLAPDEQFRLIAEAMDRLPSSAEKLDVAMSIFGKSSAEMVNVLALGRDGLDETQKAAEELGLTLSRDQAKAVEQANDAMGRIGKSVTGLGNSLAVLLAPAIETTSNGLTDLVTGFSQDIPYFLGLIEEVDHAAQERELAAGRAAAAAKVQAEAEQELTKAFEKQRDALREKLAFEKDPSQAQYEKDVKQFGAGRAGDLLSIRDQIENEQLRKEKEKAAAADAERKKAEDERKKEQQARDAERKHLAEKKREEDEVRKLKFRVDMFGKSELEKERESLLATLEDPARKAEAEGYFRQLEQGDKNKDEIDRLRKDRDTIEGRGGGDKLLDARTAEGWAALRSNVQNLQLVKLDKQIALMEENNRLLGEKTAEEVFDF